MQSGVCGEEIASFCATQKHITVCSWVYPWSLSSTRRIQCIPYTLFLCMIQFNIILPGLLSGFLYLGLPVNNYMCICYHPHSGHVPVHLILLSMIFLVMFGEGYYTLCNSSLHSFLQCTFTSSHLDSNLPLSVLFINTFSLCYLMSRVQTLL